MQLLCQVKKLEAKERQNYACYKKVINVNNMAQQHVMAKPWVYCSIQSESDTYSVLGVYWEDTAPAVVPSLAAVKSTSCIVSSKSIYFNTFCSL